MGPGDLEDILARLPEDDSPRLLSSIHTGEDAGVFLLEEGLALVQTVDFFPPIVDDPHSFGQIAAANATSDIYAMNAKPLTALNILAVPCGLPADVVEQILLGGYEKMREAGAVVVGGHTIEDEELKYGLAVTGVVDPADRWTIDGAKPGDALLLTKPLGTGILATALKGGFLPEEEMAEAAESMRTLNAMAARTLSGHRVSACTDVTGFGLLGHLRAMVHASGTSAEVWAGEVPLLERVLEMAAMGMIPGDHFSNERSPVSVDTAGVDPLLAECLKDPQTSGGLLAAIPSGEAGEVLDELRSGPCPRAALIGRFVEEPVLGISVKPGKEG